MELMHENIALNTFDDGRRASPSEEGDAGERPTSNACPRLLARTLDWDQPLPNWVTANHPDLVMCVPLISV